MNESCPVIFQNSSAVRLFRCLGQLLLSESCRIFKFCYNPLPSHLKNNTNFSFTQNHANADSYSPNYWRNSLLFSQEFATGSSFEPVRCILDFPISLSYVPLILFLHLLPGLTICLFPSELPTKISYSFLVSLLTVNFTLLPLTPLHFTTTTNSTIYINTVTWRYNYTKPVYSNDNRQYTVCLFVPHLLFT